jgi:protein arginine N-methyltransferase 5
MDKNPNAFVTFVFSHFHLLTNRDPSFRLQQKKKSTWMDRVNILHGDMRSFPTPSLADKADIMVSELLGSLGDNELSPECLDGAMRFLKRAFYSVLPLSFTAADSRISYRHLHTGIVHGVRCPDILFKIIPGNA